MSAAQIIHWHLHSYKAVSVTMKVRVQLVRPSGTLTCLSMQTAVRFRAYLASNPVHTAFAEQQPLWPQKTMTA